MKRIELGLLSVVLMVLASCGSTQNELENNQNEGEKIVAVMAQKAVMKMYTPSIERNGTVFASKEANLGSSLPGRVEKIHFSEGQNVKKGDLLVTMSGELYTQALVEYTAVKKDFERVKRLKDKGSVSEQDYDHVKAKYDACFAKKEMMRKNSEIIAPFSGTLIEKMVDEGENYLFNFELNPGYSNTSGIIRLMKLNPVKIEVDVNERDLSKVKKGCMVDVSLPAFPDTVFKATVKSIDPLLSTMTHTTKLNILLENPNHAILPGMYADVNIYTSASEYVFVPAESVYRQLGTGDDYVFVVKGKRVEKRKIERIVSQGEFIAVRGLNGNETVVTKGKNKLHDNALIDLKK